MALKIADAARRIHRSTAVTNDSDIAMIPIFKSPTQGSQQQQGGPAGGPTTSSPASAANQSQDIDMHLYFAGVPVRVSSMPGRVLRVDPSSNPATFAQQLAQQAPSAATAGCVLHIFFGAAAAKVALQTLAATRLAMQAVGNDAMLLVRAGGGDPAGGAVHVPAGQFLVKIVPTSLLQVCEGACASLRLGRLRRCLRLHALVTCRCQSDLVTGICPGPPFSRPIQS